MQKDLLLGSAMAAVMAVFAVGCDKAEPEGVEQGANVAALEQPSVTSGVQSDVVALPPPPKDTDVVVSVGEAEMTWADLGAKVEDMIRTHGANIPSSELPMAKQATRRAVVQQFIVENLIAQTAEKLGVVVDDEYITKEVAELEKEIGQPFESFAKAQGVDPEKAKEDLKKMLLEKRLLDEKVFANVNVTDEEVKSMLDQNAAEIAVATEAINDYAQQIAENPACFEDLVKANSPQNEPMDLPEEVLPHVFANDIEKVNALKEGEISPVLSIDGAKLIVKLLSRTPASDPDDASCKAKIEDIRARLAKGEDFATLAETFSDCPSGKRAGGDLGEFGKGAMVPEFEKAAFEQKVGEVGDVVKTQFGYHLIKVTERDDAKGTVRASHILVKSTKTQASVSLSALIVPVPEQMTEDGVRERLTEMHKRQAAVQFFNEQRKALNVTSTLFPEFAADVTK